MIEILFVLPMGLRYWGSEAFLEIAIRDYATSKGLRDIV
jgi:hypothetical protein